MKTPKLRVTGLCVGNSPVTGEFPAQMASNAEMLPFDDVINESYYSSGAPFMGWPWSDCCTSINIFGSIMNHQQVLYLKHYA